MSGNRKIIPSIAPSTYTTGMQFTHTAGQTPPPPMVYTETLYTCELVPATEPVPLTLSTSAPWLRADRVGSLSVAQISVNVTWSLLSPGEYNGVVTVEVHPDIRCENGAEPLTIPVKAVCMPPIKKTGPGKPGPGGPGKGNK